MGVIPKELNIYIASDYAVTDESASADPDFTEHGVFGYAPSGHLYVLDWWSGQTTADVWIESLLDLVDKWKPLAAFGEAGQIRRSVEPFLTRRVRERRSYYRQEWLASVKNKAIRGRSFQAMAASGMVVFPARVPWAEEVIEQCVSFPGGKHDDKFDVLALMCLAIDKAHPAIVKETPKQSRSQRYREPTIPKAGWKTR